MKDQQDRQCAPLLTASASAFSSFRSSNTLHSSLSASSCTKREHQTSQISLSGKLTKASFNQAGFDQILTDQVPVGSSAAHHDTAPDLLFRSADVGIAVGNEYHSRKHWAAEMAGPRYCQLLKHTCTQHANKMSAHLHLSNNR